MRRPIVVVLTAIFLSACNYAALDQNSDSTIGPTQRLDFGSSQPVNNQQLSPSPTMGQQNSSPSQPPVTASSATIVTSLGDITVKLFPDQAPFTVNNFSNLATGVQPWIDPRTGEEKQGEPLYNNTIFHRVISGFMIQGGDPLGNGTGGPGYRFQDEISPNLTFDRPYLLAMANSGPNTNGSQFFITTAPTPWLNGKHTIFGEVVGGQEIVDQIATVPTDSNDKPLQNVIINNIQIATQ